MLRGLDDASILDRYIEIKTQIAALQEELEELKGPLLAALMDEPESKSDYKGFEFSIQRRKTYAYSPHVEELERALKDAKAIERSSGTAQVMKDQAILMMKTRKS